MSEFNGFVTQDTRPELFTFDVPTRRMAGAQTFRWAVQPSELRDPLAGCGGERWRLFLEQFRAIPKKRQDAPRLSAKFVWALGPPTSDAIGVGSQQGSLPAGLFDPPGKGVADFCPDITVFDDLDGALRRVKCPLGKGELWATDPAYVHPSDVDEGGLAYPPGVSPTRVKKRYVLGLRLLLNRLGKAAAPPL